MPSNYGAKDVGFFLVSGRSILASQSGVSQEREALLSNVTALGDTWDAYGLTGQKKATMEQEGWFDSTADQANAALCEREGTSQVICLAESGNVKGRTMLAGEGAFGAKYTRILTAADLHKARASYVMTGTVEDPVILKTLAEITGDGNTDATSHDGTAGTTAGGSGYLQVTALSLGGYTNLAVTVRHSTDNVTFVTLLSFTVVTTAPNAERKTVSGNVYRYLSAGYSFTGAGGAHSATLVVGLHRN